MVRYADPTRCPDCASPLSGGPPSCPACRLPLTGPAVFELFATLQTADRLLAELRATAAPSPQPVMDDAPVAAARPVRLSAPSVPKILLSLGVLCLLVAAVTFLAVAWSWLGVGGRTAVLLVLTVSSGVLSGWLGRRDLRLAGESLAVIAFGLLCLDVVGADNAGWLGDLTGAQLVSVTGAVVGLAGAVATLLPRGSREPLVSPQVFAALGLWAVPAGLVVETEAAAGVPALAAGVLLALAAGARALGVRLLAGLLGAAAGSWWLLLVLIGADRALQHRTVAELVGQADAWPLVVAVALLVGAALLVRDRIPVSAGVLGTAGLLASAVVLVPATDNTGADLAALVVALVVAWTLGGLLVAAPWRSVAEVPLVAVTLGALALLAGPVAAALETLATAAEEPWTLTWTADAAVATFADAAHTPVLMVLPLTAALVLAGVTWRRTAAAALDTARDLAVPLTAAVGLAGAVAALDSGQPIALAWALVVLAAVGVGWWAERRTDAAGTGGLAAAGVLALGALLVALPSVGLTTITLALVVLAAAWLREDPAGAVVLPAALAGLGWSLGELVGLDEVWRATPVLLVLAALAVLRPRSPLEEATLVSGVVVGAASVLSASDLATPLAAYLTLAGALVTAAALAHEHRRRLGWLGGGLLAAATWVRLWDLGIDVPEAYTLPSAVALLLVGLRHLARDKNAGTGRALAPGLLLTTVPSLLRVMVEDPVSPRAALLGLVCLALVLAGARLRWQAPLVVGAVVGALLVLREWGPYAGAVPPWVWIAVAGTALLIVGVTWERRLRDLRGGTAYLARLR